MEKGENLLRRKMKPQRQPRLERNRPERETLTLRKAAQMAEIRREMGTNYYTI